MVLYSINYKISPTLVYIKMKEKIISEIVQSIPPSGIRKFFEMIKGMHDVISLSIGEPDFVTPWHIREVAIYNLEHGYTTYTSNSGLIELRTRISKNLSDLYGLKYDPYTEILITVGGSEALDLALRAIINPDDEIIIPQPCYVAYVPCVKFVGGKPITIPTTVENGFKPTLSQIEGCITSRTKAIILSYPNNPTGMVMNEDELLEIAALIKKYNLIAISDEIYNLLVYDKKHIPIASIEGMSDRTIFLNSFSKGYAMTGWRIGYAASNPEIIGAMTKIHQYTMLSAPTISQLSAIEALTNGIAEVQKMVMEYDHRRRVIVNGLKEIGMDCLMPGGAFYVFASIKDSGLTSEEFSEQLLMEEGIAVVPGDVFGDCGQGYIRCSYATSLPKIEEALVRIKRFVEKRRRIKC